jgi:hypothetical protein
MAAAEGFEARPADYDVDGDRIEIDLAADPISVRLEERWGDCFVGCTVSHVWRYAVADGRATLLDEGGDPLHEGFGEGCEGGDRRFPPPLRDEP